MHFAWMELRLLHYAHTATYLLLLVLHVFVLISGASTFFTSWIRAFRNLLGLLGLSWIIIMLRCPPSRITLTSSDIADFEHRLASRQTARYNKGKTAKVRLSPGPAHSTRLSFVPAEQNIARTRAASSSSEATIHGGRSGEEAEPGVHTTSPKEDDLSQGSAQSARKEASNILYNALEHRTALLESSPRRQVDSFYGTEQVLDFSQPKSEKDSTTPPVDGMNSISGQQRLVDTQSTIPWTPRGNQILGEIISDAYPTSRQPQTEPRLLASARARRRQVRSQDLELYGDSDERQEAALRGLTGSPGIHSNRRDAAPQIPELILPAGDGRLQHGLALDPGAPAFIPRMRFGTAAGSSSESNGLLFHWGSFDASNSSSNLRIRSSSEQNAEPPTHVRYYQSHDRVDQVPNVAAGVRVPTGVRTRRRSRTTDQNISLPHITPALDRYPLMRPSSSGSDGQQGNHVQPARPYAHRTGHVHHVRPAHRHTRIVSAQQQSHLQVRVVSNTGSNVSVEGGRSTRSVSPAASTSSLSTPNLLNQQSQFNLRHSSLPWSRVDSRMPSSIRVPSMVSAASGISGDQPMSRQSSREALDAAAEFLRMRNSPLDDLTEQFSRLASSRPRSVGRS